MTIQQANKITEENFLTAKQAAKLTKRARSTIYDWASKGWINPITKFNGETLYDKNEVLKASDKLKNSY